MLHVSAAISAASILKQGGFMYQRIDGGKWRHVWVVSDIHGCYQWLMDELKRRHFNPYEDLLISVGDVIDRGPDSIKCLQLMNEK
jgi:serine/threonine protein phosphatase 1